jgi:peptide/nickel transport system ATP-binding protein
VHAVSDVSLAVTAGETLGLVGESGCGKSTLARTVLRLIRETSGTVIFDGADLTAMSGAQMRAMRRRLQIIFQDPIASLNPRRRIADILAEPLIITGIADKAERDRRVRAVLGAVGLDPDLTLGRLPHEFSGGQCQRICIARSLILEPDLIVCDEPVSALDVSIRAQILNLLEAMKARYGLTLIFIAHDLAVVKAVSDRVAVMYLGRIVEVAEVETLYREPRHPYTVALLSAIPNPDPRRRRKRLVLRGDVPSPVAPPSGCRFHTRCWLRENLGNPERCVTEDPALATVGERHQAACHFTDDVTREAASEFAEQQSVVETAVAEDV